MSTPPGATSLEGAVEHAIEEAQELCKAEESSGNCAAAWDEVEELAAALAHKKVADKEKKDPLEQYCKDVPEADECRTYEDWLRKKTGFGVKSCWTVMYLFVLAEAFNSFDILHEIMTEIYSLDKLV